MNRRLQLLASSLLIFRVAVPSAAQQEFHWNWRESQSLFHAPSLQDAVLAASDRAALHKAIEEQVGPPHLDDPEMASKDQVRRAVLNANVRFISLNKDETGPPEVVAQMQHLCSPDGNCSLWFFQRTAHGYRLLLDAFGQGFTVRKTFIGGFRDLVISMHGSATYQTLKVYRYVHGGYSPVACYDADWAPLENGAVRQLKEPRISPSPCN